MLWTLVALSPWLRENLGDGTYGAWKRINDPSRELEIKCYGFKVVSYEDQGDEIVHASNPRCENIQFYASLSAPVSLSGGGIGSESTIRSEESSGNDGIPPAYVVLVEVDFGVRLCEGCYLKPLYIDDDILFSIFPNNEVISDGYTIDNNIRNSYYTFDFVGPTIAERLECSAPKGALVPAVELVAPEAASTSPEEEAFAPSVRKLRIDTRVTLKQILTSKASCSTMVTRTFSLLRLSVAMRALRRKIATYGFTA